MLSFPCRSPVPSPKWCPCSPRRGSRACFPPSSLGSCCSSARHWGKRCCLLPSAPGEGTLRISGKRATCAGQEQEGQGKGGLNGLAKHACVFPVLLCGPALATGSCAFLPWRLCRCNSRPVRVHQALHSGGAASLGRFECSHQSPHCTTGHFATQLLFWPAFATDLVATERCLCASLPLPPSLELGRSEKPACKAAERSCSAKSSPAEHCSDLRLLWLLLFPRPFCETLLSVLTKCAEKSWLTPFWRQKMSALLENPRTYAEGMCLLTR